MKTLLLLLFLMPSLSKSAEISFTCTFYGFIDKLESTEQEIKMYDKPYKKKSINLDTSKKVARTEFYQKKDQKESKVKRLYYFDKDTSQLTVESYFFSPYINNSEWTEVGSQLATCLKSLK